jgi:hypothetical protein
MEPLDPTVGEGQIEIEPTEVEHHRRSRAQPQRSNCVSSAV